MVFFATGEFFFFCATPVTFLVLFCAGFPISVSTRVFFGAGDVLLVCPFYPPFFFFPVEAAAPFLCLRTTSVTIMKERIK
jgi:hypothetical protein